MSLSGVCVATLITTRVLLARIGSLLMTIEFEGEADCGEDVFIMIVTRR